MGITEVWILNFRYLPWFPIALQGVQSFPKWPYSLTGAELARTGPGPALFHERDGPRRRPPRQLAGGLKVTAQLWPLSA